MWRPHVWGNRQGISFTSEGKASATLTKKRWLLDFLKEFEGRPISSITAPELLKVLRRAQGREIFETTRRLRSFFGQIARYAIATGRCERDVSADLHGALIAPQVTHRAAITNPKKVGELLTAIDAYDGAAITRLGLQLLALTFVRPGELRQAEWTDIDGDVWVIPATRTKMRREHRVPLSKQALKVIEELRGITGRGKYLFPCLFTPQRPMSENTLNVALRRMGYSQDEMCSHGFRSIAAIAIKSAGPSTRRVLG